MSNPINPKQALHYDTDTINRCETECDAQPQVCERGTGQQRLKASRIRKNETQNQKLNEPNGEQNLHEHKRLLTIDIENLNLLCMCLKTM